MNQLVIGQLAKKSDQKKLNKQNIKKKYLINKK